MMNQRIINRSFEDVARSYRQDVTSKLESWTETFGRIYRPADDGEYFSLTAWKSRAQEVRRLILEHKASGDKMKEALAKIYVGDALKRQTANIDIEHSEMVGKARDIIAHDFHFVMGEKKIAHGMALYAPSEAQTRLLSVLNMRQRISAEEINAAATLCSDNLQSLRLLSEIAQRHNVYFPSLPTEDDYNRAVKSLEEVAEIAVSDCAMSPDAMGYHQSVFWNTDGWGLNADAVSKLDSPVYLKIDTGETSTTDGHIKITNSAKGYE